MSDHGTHVAGTVAAAFGGGRVVGVGPNLGLAGYNTFEFIPGCGFCSYSESRWAAMIDAADRGFDVINMSLGGYGQYGGQDSQGLALFVALEKRVANYGIQPAPRYEAGVSTDTLAFYSNYGAAVDVAAPGGDCGQIGTCNANPPANWREYLVLSTTVTPDPGCAATASCPVGYGGKGGTSMAAPHVAGVAGLARDANPNLTASQSSALLTRTADRIGSRQDFGHGMVNAYDVTR